MKLKNKQTNEVAEATFHCINSEQIVVRVHETGESRTYETLEDFLSDWEQYKEESDEYWCVLPDGGVEWMIDNDWACDRGCKEIGNYFKTEEEAEKVVRKLKALKRLKEFGIKFKGPRALGGLFCVELSCPGMDTYQACWEDLCCVFGRPCLEEGIRHLKED